MKKHISLFYKNAYVFLHKESLWMCICHIFSLQASFSKYYFKVSHFSLVHFRQNTVCTKNSIAVTKFDTADDILR